MRTDRRFARFYFDVFIRDYPDIYTDDAAFATWMRLLVLAERSWPAMPELPRSVRSVPLRKLTTRELVAVGPDHVYALKGFHVERSRRHASASAAARASWSAGARASASANGHAGAMPSTSTRTNTTAKRDSEGTVVREPFEAPA